MSYDLCPLNHMGDLRRVRQQASTGRATSATRACTVAGDCCEDDRLVAGFGLLQNASRGWLGRCNVHVHTTHQSGGSMEGGPYPNNTPLKVRSSPAKNAPHSAGAYTIVGFHCQAENANQRGGKTGTRKFLKWPTTCPPTLVSRHAPIPHCPQHAQ